MKYIKSAFLFLLLGSMLQTAQAQEWLDKVDQLDANIEQLKAERKALKRGEGEGTNPAEIKAIRQEIRKLRAQRERLFRYNDPNYFAARDFNRFGPWGWGGWGGWGFGGPFGFYNPYWGRAAFFYGPIGF